MSPGLRTILAYFPELSPEQADKLEKLAEGYIHWNKRINIISRRDIPNLFEHHLLYSLAIARFRTFLPRENVLDVGTGGGLPGLPLAIFFPQTRFHLIDSIGKKIRVVKELTRLLDLRNVTSEKIRAEDLRGSYHYILGRGVTKLNIFCRQTQHLLKTPSPGEKGGIIYLTGGDISSHLTNIDKPPSVIPVTNYFKEPFFETKKIIFIPAPLSGGS